MLRDQSAWALHTHGRLAACTGVGFAEEHTDAELAPLKAAAKSVGWLNVAAWSGAGAGWRASRDALLKFINALDVELKANYSLKRTAADGLR
jgi:hypothetical protein